MSQRVKSLIPVLLALLAVMGIWGAFGVVTTRARMSPLAPDVPQPTSAHLQLIISPDTQEVSPGDTANLTVDIINDGGVPISGLSTSGSSFSTCNRTSLGSLNPGQSTNYTCQKTNIAESSLEVLTVSGTAIGTGPYSQQSDAFVKVLKPELAIVKRPKTQTVRPGDTAAFSIVIFNTSGNVLSNVKVVDNAVADCNLDPAVPLNLAPGESRDYACKQTNVQVPFTTVSSVQGTNPANGSLNQASDAAWVEVLDLDAGLAANPIQVQEPGSEVIFTVSVTNPGSLPVSLVGLTTNKYGNLFDTGNELVPSATNACLPGVNPVSIAPNGGSVSCNFVALVSGQPSDFSVVLTALARTEDAKEVSATTSATVAILDVPAVIEVNLSADPPIVSAPSGNVKFAVRVSNLSEADGVVIDELNDSLLGSLDGRGTCALPTTLISAGGQYECSYNDSVSGSAGQERERTVIASGVDDDPVPSAVSASDTITIPITNRPVQQILMPNIMDDVVEPNNKCSLAYPLQLNREYFFLPPPTYVAQADPPLQDYFRFELTTSASVIVELTNFVPRAGQLIVRQADNCDDPSLNDPIGKNPDAKLVKVVNLGTRPPGTYFIQIINDGPPETEELYGLIVKTQ